ncbi:MAG: hypothetical protein MJ071_05675 [Oscillospiraceae bacterium]|nr:hypothetical protein [Oscillospiraceae bacterium]
MFSATEQIAKAFEEANILFRIQENEEVSEVIANVAVDYVAYQIHYYSSGDTNDVSIRIPNYVRYGDKDVRKVLLAAAQCNAEYRYAKFVVDEKEHSVRMEFDFPQSTEDEGIGKMAVELFHRIMQIADKSYPKFMQAIWGGEEKPVISKSISNIEFRDIEV